MPKVRTDLDPAMKFGPDFVAALNGTLRRIAAALGGTGVAGSTITVTGGGGGTAELLATVVEQPLGAASVEIPSPGTAAQGKLAAVFITQDGTGGRSFTWNAAYQNAPASITPDAGAVTALLFCGRSDGKWWWVPV